MKVWAIKFKCSSGDDFIGSVRYRTEDEAGRAIHEILEEAFGDNYSEIEIADFEAVKVGA